MISKRIIVDTLHGQIGCVFLGTSDVHKYISYEVTNLTKRFYPPTPVLWKRVCYVVAGLGGCSSSYPKRCNACSQSPR